MRRGDKKVASQHIEMVMASVLFIGFIFFVLIFLKPYDSNILTESLIDDVYNAFKLNTETGLTQIFIEADSTGIGKDKTCFYIELDTETFKYSLKNSSVFTASGNIKNSMLSDNKLNIENNANEYYFVLISDALNQDPLSGCEEIKDTKYEIGGIIEEQIISNENLFSLNTSYYSEYKKLKESLGIPSVFDFAITSSIVSMDREDSDSSDVIAETFIEKVLLKNGTILNEQFIIKVW